MEKAIERETYYITAEQMARVNTYLPLKAKTSWVSMVAEKCLEKMEISATVNEENMAFPPVYKESMNIKSRYLMGVFVKLYLLGDFETGEDEDPTLMPEEEYDKWAGGHIFAQIERFKADKDLRDTCFNLLNDYKDLERRLNAECHALLTAMNDGVARQLLAMEASVTPESVQDLMQSLNEIKEANVLPHDSETVEEGQ